MLLWHDCITARYTPIHTFTPLAFIWLDLPMRVKRYPKERYWLLWDIFILQYYRLFCSKWDSHTGLAKSYWPSQQLQPCMLPWKRQGWHWHPESLPQHMSMGQTYITHIILSLSQHMTMGQTYITRIILSLSQHMTIQHMTMGQTSSSVCHNTWPWVRHTSHTSSSVCHKTESLMSIKQEQCNKICSNKNNSFHGMQKGGPSPFLTRKSLVWMANV